MIEQIKAALYVRLSQEDRNKLHPEDNSESINNQIMLLKSRCEKEGWIIYDIYNDDDFSGSDRQRPEFNRMIEDAKIWIPNSSSKALMLLLTLLWDV